MPPPSSVVSLPALHCACLSGSDECVQLLLAQPSPQVDRRGVGGWTAAHCCAATGNLATLRLLLSGGAAVDAADDDGLSPLHVACIGGHADVARALLEGGAAPLRPSGPKGWTAAHWAAALAHVDCLRLLQGADETVTSSPSADGRTPLELAHLLQQIEPSLGGRAIYSMLQPHAD